MTTQALKAPKLRDEIITGGDQPQIMEVFRVERDTHRVDVYASKSGQPGGNYIHRIYRGKW